MAVQQFIIGLDHNWCNILPKVDFFLSKVIHAGHLPISYLISSLTLWLFRSVLFNIYLFVNFSPLFLLLTSSFIPLWSGKVLDIISIHLNLLRLVLLPDLWYIQKCFMYTWEEYVFSCYWMVFSLSVRSIWSPVLFKSAVSLSSLNYYCITVYLSF